MMDQIVDPRADLGILWLANDPARMTADVRAVLGVDVPVVDGLAPGGPAPDGLAPDGLAPGRVALRGLVMAVRMAPAGQAFDRLVLVERMDLSIAAVLPGAIAVAWATVDRERAVDELVDAGIAREPVRALPDVEALGALALLAGAGRLGAPVLLLEPTTEGRLAATLARHGEGPCGLLVGPPDQGPIRLAAGQPTSGPHLLVGGGGYHRG